MCRRFDTIPACDGRTDGQTDRWTDGQRDGIAIASTVLAMRALRRAVKTQQQSCIAINCLSSGINILAGGRPLPHEILAPSDLHPPECSEF